MKYAILLLAIIPGFASAGEFYCQFSGLNGASVEWVRNVKKTVDPKQRECKSVHGRKHNRWSPDVEMCIGYHMPDTVGPELTIHLLEDNTRALTRLVAIKGYLQTLILDTGNKEQYVSAECVYMEKVEPSETDK